MRCDEQKCAELIALVRRSFPRPAPLGGMYLAKPGQFSQAEIDTAQMTADRLNLNITVCEGTVSFGPENAPTNTKVIGAVVIRPLP